jgi:hypothetical protein
MTDKFVFVPSQEKVLKEELKISTLLPSYIQTVTNKNFFDATFETLFSVDKTESISGYIGEKPDRVFKASTDFYIPENSKQREDYQLTPVVVTTDDNNEILKQFFYPDIINHLRYQGANVNNHERLFRQEYYSFSPLIDINKFLNYNQYYWLEKGPKTIDFRLYSEKLNFSQNSIEVINHKLQTGDLVSVSGFTPSELSHDIDYYVIRLNADNFALALTENDAQNGTKIEFSFSPSIRMDINRKTNFFDLIGKKAVVLYDIELKNGMVIRSFNDFTTSYNTKRYVVEGVGESIQLILLDELLGYDSSPYDTQPYDYDETSYIGEPTNIDYVTMQRGSKDGNPWTMRNRWFHISVLTEQEVNSAFQARRPIIEFNRNIQLYNFGSTYKGRVDVVFDSGDIQALTGVGNLTTEIDGVQVFDGMKIVVSNDIEIERSNKIYEVFGIEYGSLSLTELDTLVTGDSVFVNDGNIYGNKDVYLSANGWTIGQERFNASQDILFSLYDYEGVSLSDTSVYPQTNFMGSKLFGYKLNPAAQLDTFLQRNVETNEYNDILFVNHIDLDVYSYISDFQSNIIEGYYFFKVNDTFKNHWHKSDRTINQGIVDEFIIEPKELDNGSLEYQQIFELSQAPDPIDETGIENIIVRLNGNVLQRNIDYKLVDAEGNTSLIPQNFISLSLNVVNNLQSGDLLKITSYSRNVPKQPISGYYEVPTLVGLVGNSQNQNVGILGKNDILEHFVSILERQNKFSGQALGFNNSPNLVTNYGRGNLIIQNTASMIKLMALNSYEETDIADAFRYVENEYKRFYNKFRNKIETLFTLGFTQNNPYIQWVKTALEEINLGKSDDFPFMNSGVSGNQFVPPSCAYLGITPLYRPMMFLDETLVNPRYMIRLHDGQLIAAKTSSIADTETISVNQNTPNYVLTNSVVFPWEIVVIYNNETLIPYIDYTIFGGNSIILQSPLSGTIEVGYIPEITDKVQLFFEYEVFNTTSDKFKNNVVEYHPLEVIPGYFRKTDYSSSEFNSIMSQFFNRWVSQKGFNAIINDTYDEFNPLTWNYSSLTGPDNENLNGTWRGIFKYFYDTDRPSTRPWEMLGFTIKPDWWTSRYGNLPFTSANFTMWQDIENGIIRDGDRQGTYDYLKRPGLSEILPVDDQGNVRTIMDIFGKSVPNIIARKAEWKFGDLGPVEYEWHRSTFYNFALAMTMYLLKPSRFVDLFWEPENNLRLFNSSQLVSNLTKKRQQNTDLAVFNTMVNEERVFRYGLQQIIVEYLKYQGKDADFLQDIVHNAEIRLGYRVGGFIEKQTARFVADNFGLVPNENLRINLHKSASIKECVYSGVILTKVENGYQISGYDTVSRRFDVKLPDIKSSSSLINVGGNPPSIGDWQPDVRYNIGIYVRSNFVIYRCIEDHRSSSNFENDRNKWAVINEVPTIGGISVRKYEDNPFTDSVSYDTVLSNSQDIFNVLYGYQLFLENDGWVFSSIDSDENLNFVWAAKKIFEWILSKPVNGDTIALSPLGDKASIQLDHGFIEKLSDSVNGAWTLISSNGTPIDKFTIQTQRDGSLFEVMMKSEETEDKLFGVRLSVKEIEHSIIFDNTTNFFDIIYNDLLGIRQKRFKAFFNRSGNWNGTMSAGGYIIENDNIVSNVEKNVNDFRKFYDSEQFVIGGDFNSAAKKLIGFQNRSYFRNLLFDERDSFQFYQGFLKDKGTSQGLNKFLRNDFIKTVSNVDVHEEWAVRLGTYGALDSYSSIDVNIRQEDIRSNPQIVKFLESGEDDPRNSIIEISPNDDRYVFKRPINVTENQFKVDFIEPQLPTAGYLILSDAKYKVPFIQSFSEYFSENYGSVPIDGTERIWLAENGFNEWNVYRFNGVVNEVISIARNQNTPDFEVTLDTNSGLTTGDLIVIDGNGVRSIYEITNIGVSNNITVKTFSDFIPEKLEIDTPVGLYVLESVRFTTLNHYNTYVPNAPWENYNLVFIDDVSGKWEIRNPTTDAVVRQQEPQVNLSKFIAARLYDSFTSLNVAELIPYHPNQNILPFGVRQNIDFILSFDPANYNSDTASIENFNPQDAWMRDKVGKIWWDLRSVKYLDYDQTDDVYKLNHWGSIFPGTSVDIYQWVRSPIPPSRWEEYLQTAEGKTNYSENSRPYSLTDFVVNVEYNKLQAKYYNYYYFWVKNNEFIPNLIDIKKNLSTNDIRIQIQSPTSAGLQWISPISSDTFVISNLSELLTDTTNVRLTFINDENQNNVHNEWYLFSDKTDDRNPPQLIIDKMKHSLLGFVEIIDTNSALRSSGLSNASILEYGTTLENGLIQVRLPVPDPNIISTSQYGNLFRPRQSWFNDKFAGREAFVHSVNRQLAKENWVDSTNDWQKYLFDKDPEPDSTQYDFKVISLFERDNLIGTVGFITDTKVLVENDITKRGRWSLWNFNGVGFDLIKSQGFRSEDYWSYADFYLNGFSAETPVNKIYNTLLERNSDIDNLQVGDIVRVNDDGSGNFILTEVILSIDTKAFRLVGKGNGTFKFDSVICVCPFSDEAFSVLIDGYFAALSSVQDRNKVVVDMIREATRQNRVVDWAFKTSLVDLVGLEEVLEESPITRPDLSENVIDYFNELKPYHVKIRGFIDRKFRVTDDIKIEWMDEHQFDMTILIDKVSCVADMSLPVDEWKAAERITAYGGNPSDTIPGCKFRGSDVDAKYFTFFSDIIGAGFDVNSYDSTVLGYDFDNQDIQTLYDIVINGQDFTTLPAGMSEMIVDGGSFYQPLLSDNRPPEFVSFHMGDTISIDVYTLPYNVDIQFGYDTQPYDDEVTEENQKAGYDYESNNPLSFTLRPKMIQDLYLGNGANREFQITQIPQSNDAIFVYVNDVLIDDYTVDWTGLRPKVVLTTIPTDKTSIKILSYSIGGSSNTIATFYKKNASGNIFDMEEQIPLGAVVIATVNGVEVTAEWSANGNAGLENHEVRIPSVSNGDTVYIVVYEGSDIAKIYTERYINDTTPYSVANLSAPVGPQEINTIVYKNGVRLVPSYTRYFDPIVATDIFYSNEWIRNKDYLRVFTNRSLFDPTLYSLDINKKEIRVNTPIAENTEVLLINDTNAEYHFDGNDLYIHNVAYASKVTPVVPVNSRLVVNSTVVTFTRPDGSGDIPLDFDNGFYRIQSVPFGGSDVALGITANLTINNSTVSVLSSDTLINVINKVNNLFGDTRVNCFLEGTRLILRSQGNNIILSGDWNSFGITNGSYLNVVTRLNDALGTDFRVLSLDGRLKIIDRTGVLLNLVASGAVDMLDYFGLNTSYSNAGTKIMVTTMDDNTTAIMRTEVYEGNILGEYPITQDGFSDYSSVVTVLGIDSINFSDFSLETLQFGYDLYGYDSSTYDYSELPGVTFKIPHLQNQTVIVTTYNGTPREMPVAFRIFKNLRNEFKYYRISDDNSTRLVQPLRTTDTQIVVEDATYLSVPSPEKNVPGTIWIEGEVIGYFEVDTSVPGAHVLSKLIRGAQGTPFGVVNERIETNGVVTDEYLKNGTLVRDFSGQIFNMKNINELWMT